MNHEIIVRIDLFVGMGVLHWAVLTNGIAIDPMKRIAALFTIALLVWCWLWSAYAVAGG